MNKMCLSDVAWILRLGFKGTLAFTLISVGSLASGKFRCHTERGPCGEQ